MANRGRPRKEPPPFDPEVAKEYIERFFTVVREVKVLQDDKKQLKEEFKDKLDLKLVGAVIRLVKASLKVNASDETKQDLEDLILDKINMVVGD